MSFSTRTGTPMRCSIACARSNSDQSGTTSHRVTRRESTTRPGVATVTEVTVAGSTCARRRASRNARPTEPILVARSESRDSSLAATASTSPFRSATRTCTARESMAIPTTTPAVASKRKARGGRPTERIASGGSTSATSPCAASRSTASSVVRRAKPVPFISSVRVCEPPARSTRSTWTALSRAMPCRSTPRTDASVTVPRSIPRGGG